MAAYDEYDYPSYWKTREYEHQSEIYALKELLKKIPHIKKILEIGGGYGRLLSTYAYRGKKVILSEPSIKMLALAKKRHKSIKNIVYMQSTLSNLPKKIRRKSVDLVIVVRVFHHIEDLENSLKIIHNLLLDDGYFILEFANKSHFKAIINNFLHGNFTFPVDIFSKDIRCPKNIKSKTLPFINYHPDMIYHTLEKSGFNIIEKRSVSNIRFPYLKGHISTELLLEIEKMVQVPLSYFNFGPSIFVLCKKA